ncbi:MAG: LTA synthase family protein [Prevotella sp.]|nr:LTA synthase family protein [Prevotella sp.]
MKERLFFLLKFLVWTLLVFILAKVGFLLICQEGHDFHTADVWQVITHGLSLDFSMSLYLFALPFLLTLASLWWRGSKWLKRVFRALFVLYATAMALAFVADASLYPFWGFKLDASCLQYLSTPNEAAASVTTSYLVVRALALLVLVIVLYCGYEWLLRSVRWEQCPSRRTAIAGTVGGLLLIPLIVIGIRGGLGESTTNIGQVYYSQNQFLNHAAVNPMFSFFASLEKTASNNVSYHFMDDAACERIIAPHFPTVSDHPDTLLTTQRPNIILILLESCGATFTELGGRTDVTPHLNRLAREGVSFARCYGNTWRTDRGTVCTWSGYPSFPTMSVMKMPAKSRTLPNLAATLRQEGYATSYLYGGDINFTNMRSYLVGGGFETLHWMEDYTAEEQKSARWGVRDDITFATLYDMATTAQQPFLIGFSTLSSHQPWDVPIQHFDDPILNAFYYLDQCIGNFISRLRQSDVWENTLVILLPDHGIPYKDIGETKPLKNQIPLIWTGGAVRGARCLTQVCNQTDLPATLLGQLGLSHTDYTFSRDVVSHNYTRPFAINTYDDGFSIYDSVSFVSYDFIADRIVAREGRENPSLVTLGKAVLQAASNDLNAR